MGTDSGVAAFAKGIDWNPGIGGNGPLPPSALLGQDFVLLKVTQWPSYRAEWFRAAFELARSRDLLVGVYAFGDFGPGAPQADMLVDTVQGDGVRPDWWELDLEYWAPGTMTDAQARAFFARMDQRDEPTGLYGLESTCAKRLGQRFNHVCLPGTTHPSVSWALQQVGIQGVDRDIFHGTRAQMRAWAASLQGGFLMGLSQSQQEQVLAAAVASAAFLAELDQMLGGGTKGAAQELGSEVNFVKGMRLQQQGQPRPVAGPNVQAGWDFAARLPRG